MTQGPHTGTESRASGWRTFGHPGAVRYLARSVETGRLAHAYLITGSAHVGKRSLALDLALAVNCEPPADLFGETPAPQWNTAHAPSMNLSVAQTSATPASLLVTATPDVSG